MASILAITAAQAAGVDNAWSAFSLKSNPNGPWSYLSGGTLLGQTIPNCEGYAKLLCRWNGQQPSSSCVAAANKTGATATFYTIVLPPRYIWLDPENTPSSTVQWTAPITGSVIVTGNFLGIDTSEATHTVAVTHNGTALKTWSVGTYQQKIKFSFTVPVKAGDTVAFQNITNNAYANLSIGLQATIRLQ